MKFIYIGILLLVTEISFSQLKGKQIGWYQGETKDFVLYQNILDIKEKEDFIDVEALEVCLYLKGNTYELRVGNHTISGSLETKEINKREIRLVLKSTDFGPFTVVLNKQKKYAVLIGKSQQSSTLLNKLKKKESCD
jgi:hypothetical protein